MALSSSGLIEFDTVIPEQLRGLPRYQAPVNWDALELVCRNTIGSELQKRFRRKTLFKDVKKHGIGILLPRLRLSYVTARLALGDFSDYWGWEFRGVFDEAESRTWAADLYWSETWLPKWGGGNIERLIVLGEQGVGDQVFYASILPEAMIRCREVVYECDARLHTMLERSLRGLKCRPEREFEDRRPDYGRIDAYIPAAELMRMFRQARSHFPGRKYLKADPNRVAEFERYRGMTGISWKGRQGSLDPLELALEGVVSLQYNDRHVAAPEPHIDLKDDLEGVLALCSVLKKVVTVPTSVHHIAGAAGVQTQIIVPNIRGEVENQVKFDYSVLYNHGKLLWYPAATVYESVAAWKHA